MLSQFFKDTTFNVVQQGWALIIGLITSVVVARGLGAEDRGIYAIVIFLSFLVILFLNSGIEPAIIYHIARGHYQLQDIIDSSLILTTVASALGCFAAFIIITVFRTFLFPTVMPDQLMLSLFVIPSIMFATNTEAIFRGLQDFRTYSLIEIITQPIALVLSIILVLWLHLGVLGAIIAIALRYITVVGFVGFFLKKRLIVSPISKTRFQKRIIRDLFSYSMKVYIYNVSVYLNQRADVLLLNLMRTNPALIGIYDVAVALAERFWTFCRAISIVIFSRIAAMENQEVERNRLTSIVTRHVLWITLTLAVILYFLSDWLIGLVYGPEFLGSALALRLLLPGTVMLGVGLIISNDVSGRGKPHLIVVQSFFGLAINIGVNLIVIPQLSFAGAAIASSISYSVIAVLTIITFSRLTGVPWHQLIFPTRADIQLWRKAFQWLRIKLQPKTA